LRISVVLRLGKYFSFTAVLCPLLFLIFPSPGPVAVLSAGSFLFGVSPSFLGFPFLAFYLCTLHPYARLVEIFRGPLGSGTVQTSFPDAPFFRGLSHVAVLGRIVPQAKNITESPPLFHSP